MTVRTSSTSMSPEVEAGGDEAAWAEGRAAALELVADYEAEHGSIPEDSRRRVEAFLDGLGPFEAES